MLPLALLVLILVGCASNNSGPSRKMVEYYRAYESSAEALGWSDVRPIPLDIKLLEQITSKWHSVKL